ncbi:MAG: DUF4139 domain-containing protein [Planctomycetota bacterium]|jgi:hypothetical protein
MKRHLTERELIEYQFGLGSEVRVAEIAGHLRDCGECREHLEELRRKFAALDLLREDVEVSEDLISRVVEQAGQPVRTRIVSFGRAAWIGAAAAVLLMCSLLLVSYLGEDRAPTREFAKEPSTPADLDMTVAAEEKYSFEVAKHGRGITKGLRAGAKSELVTEKIPEQPPFAPASAIELVTLPRRESVQLTIYNSTVQNQPVPVGQGGYGGAYGGGYGGRGGRGGYGGGPYGGRYLNVDNTASVETRERTRRRLPPQPSRVIPGSDLTLVRDRRNLTLKKGWNWLQFMWTNTLIDPTSLHLEPLEQKGEIDIQQLVFPSRLRELGRWLIRSEVGGQVPFEITYFTSGLSWRAFYMGTLSADERKMKLQGYVRVSNNSGEDYENAQTRLIVGKVHILEQIAELARRRYPYGRPGRVVAHGYGGYGGGVVVDDMEKVPLLGDVPLVGGLFGDAAVFLRKEIRKEGLSEYFLYTIEGTETIPDKWGKRLLSFEEEDIEVKSLYKYDEERYGGQTVRFVAFANDEEHNLGKTPIPNGNVKIYSQADSEGYLSYVGGTNVKYIPVDEEVELNLGPARLVKVEPTLMDFKTANYVFDRKKNIIGWDEIRAWKIEITNTRTLPVEIEITRGFGTAYWTLQADIPYEKHDVTHARVELTVQPRGKRVFNYTVTTYHGVREEAITE